MSEESENEKQLTVKSVDEHTETEQLNSDASTVTLFNDSGKFEHAQRVAKMLSTSELVPKRFQGNIQNCMIAMEMAGRINATPMMVMQSLYIVHGNPSWSSQFLIATFNKSGKFGLLKYEEDPARHGGSCRCYAYERETGERLDGVWVSVDMAKAEGWSTKSGSKWKTIPQLMLRYRAASWFIRQVIPDISMGMMTSEEHEDIGHEDVTSKKTKWTNPPENGAG